MRGRFVVIEGCDRSGKTTQCEMLVHALQQENEAVQLFKFPDRTTQTGKMIDSYLKQSIQMDDHAIHLLFSANRWEAMNNIKSLLEKGTTIIVDRYAFSGVAFSSAKGLDFNWCKQPDVGLLVPDLVMFLDLSMEEAEKRGGFGEERYEKRDLQLKVRNEFNQLMDDSWKIIDASQPIEIVHQCMLNTYNSIQDFNLKPLAFDLWK
ncbi:thymidylate kinase [Cunninghamella echinulata]|nr:thymidylate kinase [Cunninghamella echinulata]